MTEIDIAKVCHETNKAYCEVIGDFTQKPWEQAEHWQRLSCIAGVRWRLQNLKAKVSLQHDIWVANKVADGWRHGTVKSLEYKTHPCICTYQDLPPMQKIKDVLFVSIVLALSVQLEKKDV